MWPVVEYDFAAILGVDLETAARERRTLRWLQVRLTGLLNDDRAKLHAMFYGDGKEPTG